MKNFTLSFVLILMCIQLNSQEKELKIHNNIIQQIWKPFKKSFDTKDAKAFNSLHTDTVLRINAWGIKQGKAYKDGIIRSYSKNSKRTRTIEFWIEQSVFSDSVSHQIGYYAITYKEPNKKDKTSYAQFQVTLKKINRMWKISQDFDTENVGGIKVDATFIKHLKKLRL